MRAAPAKLLVVMLLSASSAAFLVAGYALRGDSSSEFPRNDSVEAGFARDMSTHHLQAVEMAEIIRDRVDDDHGELYYLAVDIALTQQAQIGRMRGWLDIWGLRPSSSVPAMAWMDHAVQGRMPGLASESEIAALRDGNELEAEKKFLRLMIRHHESGITMAEAAAQRSTWPEVRDFASDMAKAQRSEIRSMEAMLDARSDLTPGDAPARQEDGGGSHSEKNH